MPRRRPPRQKARGCRHGTGSGQCVDSSAGAGAGCVPGPRPVPAGDGHVPAVRRVSYSGLADGFAQPGRSLPGGCRQRDADSRVAVGQQGQEARRRGGLARSGTAGHQDEGSPEAQPRRASLGRLWVGKELNEIISSIWGCRVGGRACDRHVLMGQLPQSGGHLSLGLV